MQARLNANAQEFLKSPNLSKTYTVSYTLTHAHKISMFICHTVQVDVYTSKSVGRKAVWVRLPPPAPHFPQMFI